MILLEIRNVVQNGKFLDSGGPRIEVRGGHNYFWAKSLME